MVMGVAGAAAAQAPTIEVEVMVSHISDGSGSIDARGQKLHEKLKGQFRYESLKVLQTRGLRLALDEVALVSAEPSAELLDLDEALKRLGEQDPRKARAVELRYFGGLTIDETARVMGVSQTTLHRELRMAKAWLQYELTSEK